MPSFCVAYGCSNNSAKQECLDKKISFHTFPLQNKSLLDIWLVKIRRKEFTPNKYSKLCSEHFEKGCFLIQKTTGRRIIKPNAIPTLFGKKQLVGSEEKTQESKSLMPTKSLNSLEDVTTSIQDETEELCSQAYEDVMTNIYFYRLDDESKQRYLDKLEYNGISLPDPLDSDLRLRLYKHRSLKMSPDFSFGDIYIYLVETEQAYSREEFKNYKNLDCYEMVSNRKVRDILAYKCESTNMCVLTCDVESDGSVTKLYRTWVAIEVNGSIKNGHCTCMSGFSKICCHVAALLFALEIAIKKDLFYENSGDSALEKTVERKTWLSLTKFLDINKKSYLSTKINSSSTDSITSGYKEQLQVIKKIVPNAPIFTLLSDSDLSSEEEYNEVEMDEVH